MPGLIHLLRAVTKPIVITLSLLGLLSTVLNFIQVLNGNLCFSTVVTDTLVDTRDVDGNIEARISRLTTSGYKEGSHNIGLSTACFEPYIPSAHNDFCAFNSTHLNCHQEMHLSHLTYTDDISCDCRTNRSFSAPFSIVVSPGTNILQGLQAPETSFYCFSNLNIARCSLNGQFYTGFILACIAFIFGMILLNAMSDGVLRGFFAWLATTQYCSAVYDWLENRGFFSYGDNHRNKPFKVLPGQPVLRLCKRSDVESMLRGSDEEIMLQGNGEEIMLQVIDEESMLQGSGEEIMLQGSAGVLPGVVANGRGPRNYFYHSSNLTIQVSVVDVSVVDGTDLREVAAKVYFVDWRGPRNLNSVKVDEEGYAKLIKCMEWLSKGIPTLDCTMGHILSIEEIVEIVEASEGASLTEVTFDEEKVFFGI